MCFNSQELVIHTVLIQYFVDFQHVCAFTSTFWLPLGQYLVVAEGKASLTNVGQFLLSNFDMRPIGGIEVLGLSAWLCSQCGLN